MLITKKYLQACEGYSVLEEFCTDVVKVKSTKTKLKKEQSNGTILRECEWETEVKSK